MDLYTNNPLRNAGAYTTHDPTTAQGGAVYFGTLKRWSGSDWPKAKLNVYSGGAWVQKPLKRWDGTAWKEVDVTG